MKEPRRSTGTKWWPLLGYSQAVTCGNLASGTWNRWWKSGRTRWSPTIRSGTGAPVSGPWQSPLPEPFGVASGEWPALQGPSRLFSGATGGLHLLATSANI
jgi:hypothetical protein